MTRLLASIAVAAMLAIGGSVAWVSVGGQETAVAASRFKQCKSKTPAGAVKSWRCGTDQACCVNHTMGLYVCGIPGLGCL